MFPALFLDVLALCDCLSCKLWSMSRPPDHPESLRVAFGTFKGDSRIRRTDRCSSNDNPLQEAQWPELQHASRSNMGRKRNYDSDAESLDNGGFHNESMPAVRSRRERVVKAKLRGDDEDRTSSHTDSGSGDHYSPVNVTDVPR
jgi:hypothetical protein